MRIDPHFRFEQPRAIKAPLVTRVRRTCRSVAWGAMLQHAMQVVSKFASNAMRQQSFSQSSLREGSCAAERDSHYAALGGCKVKQPEASKN